MTMQILAASPINPDLRRPRGNRGLDPFADSSTSADEERSVRPDTVGWHYINIPLGASRGDLAKCCPPSAGWVMSTITAQIPILRRPDATP